MNEYTFRFKTDKPLVNCIDCVLKDKETDNCIGQERDDFNSWEEQMENCPVGAKYENS